MRYILLAFLVGFLVAQEEPPPYPEGMTCSPRGTMAGGTVVDATHPCHCKRMDADPLCEGKPTEEASCLQFCRHDKCGCPIICAGGSHH